MLKETAFAIAREVAGNYVPGKDILGIRVAGDDHVAIYLQGGTYLSVNRDRFTGEWYFNQNSKGLGISMDRDTIKLVKSLITVAGCSAGNKEVNLFIGD